MGGGGGGGLRGPDDHIISCHSKTPQDATFKLILGNHVSINVQENILPRTMEWLRDATNALEQEDFF